MTSENFLYQQIESKTLLKASRSSGAGGQHVNKTSSKVTGTLLFDDLILLEEEKQRLQNRFGDRLVMWSQKSRSQFDNRKDLVQKMTDTVFEVIQIPKNRRATEPSKKTIAKAKKQKAILSEKKQQRRWQQEL